MSLSTGLELVPPKQRIITNGAIKACPHCGGKSATTDLRIGDYTEGVKAQLWRVICTLCHAASGYSFTELEAVEKWNKRAV